MAKIPYSYAARRRPLDVPWHEDVGVQPERTALAWTRTAISLAVVSSVFLRWAREFGPWMLLIICGYMISAALIVVTSRRRYSLGVHGIIKEKVQPNTLAVVMMTASSIVMGLLTLILVITH